LLDINKDTMGISKRIKNPYVRVLGFNNNGKKLISEIVLKNPDINLITSVKKFVDNNCDEYLNIMIEKDIFATNVYSLAFRNNSFSNLDFKNGIINC
jgi:hypothetical protein